LTVSPNKEPMMFVRNAWYVAAWSAEVSAHRPFARTLLDEPVVLFRDPHGRAQALADRCPHRFAPLHKGDVRDGTLGCPYHGLRFDGTGRCTLNPHGDGRIPEAARVRSFPLLERHGAIWIWMGEPAQADGAAAALPDFSFVDPEHNEVSTGYLLTRAHYQLSADNLLDLSHFQYLHPDTLGSPGIAGDPGRFSETGDTVRSHRRTEAERLPPFVARAFGVPDGMCVDRQFEVRWNPPGLMAIDIRVAPAGMTHGRESRSAHLLTPETAASTHYFFAFGLPKTLGPAARTLVDYALAGLTTPFRNEDLPMLEAQQAALGDGDFWERRPVLLPIDGGAIRARRIIERKLAEEAQCSNE
jgi:vanillate O-demethylase monooxygenase subunit